MHAEISLIFDATHFSNRTSLIHDNLHGEGHASNLNINFAGNVKKPAAGESNISKIDQKRVRWERGTVSTPLDPAIGPSRVRSITKPPSHLSYINDAFENHGENCNILICVFESHGENN